MNKRIISLFTVIILVITTLFSAASAFAEDTGAELMSEGYAARVEKLTALGLLPEDIDLTSESAVVTREIFLKTVLKYVGYESIIPQTVAVKTFADVEVDYEYAPEIETGYNLGMLVGYSDGRFYPTGEITVNQAVKVLVNALGYDDRAKLQGGYPAGHLAIASTLRILNGVITGDTALTNRNMIYMLDNIIDVDQNSYENINVKTLIQERHDIYSIKGVVNATSATAFEMYETTTAEMVTIGSEKFYKGSATDIDTYLGYQAEAFYRLDTGEEYGTIVYFSLTKNNTVLNVPGKDIAADHSAFSAYNFVYTTDTDDYEEISVRDANIVFNGKFDKYYSEADLNAVNGEVTFVDNNSDGVYDLVNIFKPTEIIVADTASIEGGIVSVTSAVDRTNYIQLDTKKPERYKIIKNGEAVAATDIAAGDVILVGEANNVDYRVLYVSSGTVDVTITALDEGQRRIYGEDGSEYEYSESYSLVMGGESDLAVKPEIGISAKLYLDIYGYVQGISGTAADGPEYAYLINLDDENSDRRLSDPYRIKLLTTKNGIVVYPLADSVQYNEAPKKAEEMISILRQASSTDEGRGGFIDSDDDGAAAEARIVRNAPTYGKLIKFDTNADGEVNIIYTADETDKFSYDGSDIQTARYGYYLSTWGRKIWWKSGNPMFRIYVDQENKTINEDYSTVTTSYTNDDVDFNRSKVFFYDIDEMLTVGAAVVYYDGSSGAESNAAIPDSTRTFAIVTSKSDVLDVEGNPASALKAMTTAGKEVTIAIGANTNEFVKTSLESVEPGDIVLYAYDTQGSLSSLVRIFDQSKKQLFGAHSLTTNSTAFDYSPHEKTNIMMFTATKWISYGKVEKYNGTYVTFYTTGNDGAPTDLVRANVSSASMALIDLSGSKPRVVPNYSHQNIRSGDKIFVMGRYGTEIDMAVVRY